MSRLPPFEKPAAQTAEGLVGRGRVTRQGDHVLVVGLEQVGPVLRDGLDDGGVDLERHDTVVVAVPQAGGVLGRVRDRVPGRDLVRLVEVLGDALRAVAQADVDDVRRLRAGVGLVGDDGRQLVLRAAARVEPVDRDPVLGGEPVDDGTVVAPVARERDRVQAAFGLGGRDEGVHAAPSLPTRRPRRRRGGGRRGRSATGRRSGRSRCPLMNRPRSQRGDRREPAMRVTAR